MDFEKIEKIWNEKNQNTMYVIDEQTLHKKVLKDNIDIRRSISIIEWTLCGTLLFLSLMMLIEGILDHEYYQIPEGIILLIAANYIYRNRKKRIEFHKISDTSILDDVHNTIAAVNYHAKHQKNLIWYYLIPLIISSGIHAYYTYGGKPWWVWLLSLFSYAISFWVIKYISRKILSNRKNLIALKKLMDSARDI